MLLSFNVLWKNCCKSNSKLRFYNSIKPVFGPEIYLEITQEPFESVKHLIRIRMFSHLFHIETGRYLNLPAHERICRCCTDLENAQLLAVLPISEVYIEDEERILFPASSSKIFGTRHTLILRPCLPPMTATDYSETPMPPRCWPDMLKELLRDSQTRRVVSVAQPG